ncbi:right-handed parallel beta-helix repeat-containing protein [Candidatus Woesearchaeota archaeon]|nr:right-handed parallel beta-helix repeat-containing protein [Candidatus Woesearchaeota archaeon]
MRKRKTAKRSFESRKILAMIILLIVIIIGTTILLKYSPIGNIYGGAITNSNSKIYDGTSFDIDSCGTITASGEYTVVQDLITDSTCIQMSQRNSVTINGNGMTITNIRTFGGYFSIRVAGGSDNITVKNFKELKSFASGGVDFAYSNGTLYNNTIIVESGIGLSSYKLSSPSPFMNVSKNIFLTSGINQPFAIDVSTDSLISDNVFIIGGGTGIRSRYSAKIKNNTFLISGSDRTGIYLQYSNATIESNIVQGINTSIKAIDVIDSSNVTIHSNTLSLFNASSRPITLTKSNRTVIESNVIYSFDGDAINIISSNDTIISYNNITTQGYNAKAIIFQSSTRTTLNNNNLDTINTTPIKISSQTGPVLSEYYDQYIDSTNKRNGKPILYYYQTIPSVIENAEITDSIYLLSADDSSIQIMNIINTTVFIKNAKNILLNNSNVYNRYAKYSAIEVEDSSNVMFNNFSVDVINSSTTIQTTRSSISLMQSRINLTAKYTNNYFLYSYASNIVAVNNNFTINKATGLYSMSGGSHNMSSNMFYLDSSSAVIFNNINNTFITKNNISRMSSSTDGAISVTNAKNTSILSNTLVINGTAILLNSVKNSSFSKNSVTSIGGFSTVVSISESSNNILIENNNVTISSKTAVLEPMFIGESSNITIAGNNINSWRSGSRLLRLFKSDFILLKNNVLNSNGSRAVYIENSNFSALKSNIITTEGANAPAIYLESSMGANISNNVLNTRNSPPLQILQVGQSFVPAHYNHTVGITNTRYGKSIVYYYENSPPVLESIGELDSLYIINVKDIIVQNVRFNNTNSFFVGIGSLILRNITYLRDIKAPGISISDSSNFSVQDSIISARNSSNIFDITRSNFSIQNSIINFSPDKNSLEYIIKSKNSEVYIDSNIFQLNNSCGAYIDGGTYSKIINNNFSSITGVCSFVYISDSNNSLILNNIFAGERKYVGSIVNGRDVIIANNSVKLNMSSDTFKFQNLKNVLFSSNKVIAISSSPSYGILYSINSENITARFNYINVTFFGTGNNPAIMSFENSTILLLSQNNITGNNPLKSLINFKGVQNADIEGNILEALNGTGVTVVDGALWSFILNKNITISLNNMGVRNGVSFEKTYDTNVSNNNITIIYNGQGASYFYSNNSIITHNNFVGENMTMGIKLSYSNYSKIYENNVDTGGKSTGISVSYGADSIVWKNVVASGTYAATFDTVYATDIFLNNLLTKDERGNALSLFLANYTIVKYNNITALENSSKGIHLYSSTNGLFLENNVTTIKKDSPSLVFSRESTDNLFINDTLNSQKSSDVDYSSIGNNTFTNVRYKKDSVIIVGDGLAVQWYVQSRVLDSEGSIVPGAAVKVYDSNNILVGSYITDSEGKIPVLNLTEAILRTPRPTYYTPYVLTARRLNDPIIASTSLDLREKNSTSVDIVFSESEDSKNPEVQIILPSNIWQPKIVLLKANITDDSDTFVKARYEYGTFKSAWIGLNKNGQLWEGVIDLSTEWEKNYTIRLNATDIYENSNVTETINISLDKTPPQSIQIMSPPTPQDKAVLPIRTYSSKINFVESNPDICVLTVNNKEYVQPAFGTSCEIFRTESADGNYTFNTAIQDKAGNKATSSSRTIMIDSIAPEIMYQEPTPDNGVITKNNTFTANITFTEQSIQYCRFYTDGIVIPSIIQENTCVATTTALFEGVHYYNFVIFDTAGNTASSDLRTFIVDTTKPSSVEFIGLTPDNSKFVGQNYYDVKTSFIELNPESCIITTIDYLGVETNYQMTINGNNCDATVGGISDGIYTYFVTLTDKVGLTDRSGQRTLIVDTQAPKVTLQNPTNGALITTPNARFNVSIDEPNINSIKFFIDGQERSSILGDERDEYVLSQTLQDGITHKWYVIASDNAGHTTTTQEYNFMIDSSIEIPTVLLYSPKEGLYNGRILVNATVTDDGTVRNVEYRLESKISSYKSSWTNLEQKFNKWNATLNTQLFEDGEYLLRINATDNNKHSNTEAITTIKIDNTPPNITLQTPADNEVFNITAVRFSYAVKDDNKFNGTIYVNGAAVEEFNKSGTYNLTKNLTIGNHSWNATARDMVGNFIASPTKIFLIINITSQYGASNYNVSLPSTSTSTGTTMPSIGGAKTGEEQKSEQQEKVIINEIVEQPTSPVPETPKIIAENETIIMQKNEEVIQLIPYVYVIILLIAVLLTYYSLIRKKVGEKSEEETIRKALNHNILKGFTYKEVGDALISEGWKNSAVNKILRQEREKHLKERVQEYMSRDYTRARILDLLSNEYSPEEVKREVDRVQSN